jgi:anti-anti-sigma factor
MAKVRHRIFEMYEFREEAIDMLTPRSAQPVTETEAPEPWTLKHLAVSRLASVWHVEFKKGQTFEEETEKELREDLTQLAKDLIRNSKVLFDFTGVMSISSASIDAFAHFNQKLRTKGSRIALCCIAPDVRQTLFKMSNGHENRI